MLESSNGEMNTHPSYRIHDNRTEVTLTLAPNESVFIVFPTEEAADKERTSTDKREPLNRTLETEEYTVTFLATGKTVVRKDLFDWSKEEDEQIRYYSGTAVYKATFRWKDKLKKGQPVYLNLGKVCNLATVRVNGIDCGTVWTAPYRADITSALKKERTNWR